MTAELRLPDPVDPAAPPRRLLRAAAVVLLGGAGALMIVVLGVATARSEGASADLSALGGALVGVWAMSLPVGAALLLAFRVTGRSRLRRYERRAGFLPRHRRTELPATGRTTLFRVEYGQRAARICLMLARWDYRRERDHTDGWRRSDVLHHAWLSADDPVALGVERARMEALAEQLEDEADDARFDHARRLELATERLSERAAARERATWLAEQFARDTR